MFDWKAFSPVSACRQLESTVRQSAAVGTGLGRPYHRRSFGVGETDLRPQRQVAAARRCIRREPGFEARRSFLSPIENVPLLETVSVAVDESRSDHSRRASFLRNPAKLLSWDAVRRSKGEIKEVHGVIEEE